MKSKKPRSHPPTAEKLPRLETVGLCRRWIAVLILEGRSNKYIAARLAADDLPSPSESEIEALRAEYKPCGKKKSPKYNAIVDGLGLEPFVAATREREGAFQILRTPRLRELVEAGAITGVPAEAISLTVRVNLRADVPPAAVKLYIAIFFDVNDVSRAVLRVLVHARVRLAVSRAVIGQDDDAVARRAVEADARSVALSMPSSTIAWQTVLMAAGFSPGRRDLAEVVEQLETIATVRAGEALLRGGVDDERRADSCVAIVTKLRQLRSTITTPDADMQKQLARFQIKHDEQCLPTASDLRARGDDVTVDMGPPVGEQQEEGRTE